MRGMVRYDKDFLACWRDGAILFSFIAFDFSHSFFSMGRGSENEINYIR